MKPAGLTSAGLMVLAATAVVVAVLALWHVREYRDFIPLP
jgi:hypothetical protein